MTLHGKSFIGQNISGEGEPAFRATNPATGEPLEPSFYEATHSEIDQAMRLAEEAFHENRGRSPEERAALLDCIADEIEALGDVLVDRVLAETALPEGRIRGERGRTTGQLRLFAEVVREGSWVEARIDRALPDRKPAPKPDLRRMLLPIGPVVVFGASNFPLAFSVAGGDTASALAAGCPVIVKAHPAHPGTSEMVAVAIRNAVESSGFHPGTFSMIHAVKPEMSLELVRHPLTRAVGFTGSLRAGRAIFDAAAARPVPIPVYAEMGSVNPVFVLPGALNERSDVISKGLVESVTQGAGQFCTNPGLVFGQEGAALQHFIEQIEHQISQTPVFTMLNSGIRARFDEGVKYWSETSGVRMVGTGTAEDGSSATPVRAAVFTTDTAAFEANPHLHEEVFGPASLVVRCGSPRELERVALNLPGNLTATLHGTEEDLREYAGLIRILENKVGRIIFNGFPTGVEVCPSMHHGGPYPATTDVRTTSVGTAAIYRFARPIAYQGFPQEALPPELRDENPRRIWRLVDNHFSRDPL